MFLKGEKKRLRILILSCNTGEGHNSAAFAVADSFEKNNVECIVKDALAFWSPEKSKIISKGHVFLYRRMPKFFGMSYRFEENHPAKEGEESLMYDLVTKGCKALKAHLDSEKYSAVLCTHVFSAMMITEIKKKFGLDIKSYFISTDYTCTPGVSETRLDVYFLPHRLLAEEFYKNGIKADTLVPAGIPVRRDFYTKIDKKAARKKIGIPEAEKMVLLTCGSMGCGPIKKLAQLLSLQLSSDTVLTVICGSNRRLYKSLIKLNLSENIRIVGYTKRMSVYMDAADIILTKPGGLSSTEAAAKKLPMIFINAVPGCETRNLEFFVTNGFAEHRDSLEELAMLVCDYSSDIEKINMKSQKLHSEFFECTSDFICEYVLNDVKEVVPV